MMTPIVERKKKGRPSKADLARRAGASQLPAASEQESEVRRHVRRRRARYTLDVDDLIDELDGEEEDERRKEKKMKQLLKLQNNESGSESAPNRNRRVEDAPADSASSSGGEDGDRPLKKRKIDGGDEIDGDDEHEQVRRRKAGSKVDESVPGTPSDPMVELPSPEKKSLELILDKLQKKDTYGVYAEPVDPDELPDYHDVIEHPMDFATVRKKLGNGLYSTLEQFENDIYLICANAMQYNAPDTIYYKQAHSIQELAKKNFQELRIDVEHYEKEPKSGQNPRSNSSTKQQMKKPTSTTLQEPVSSDFYSGATLATTSDFQNGMNATRDGGFERLTNVDGPVGENTSLVDNNYVKAKDLQGRVPLSRIGRKAFTDDDNRRATYSISNKPLVGSESIFTTFDDEVKQLVAVGIHADQSYARSLALFAATLGPVAWKVASGRIEEALPHGFKYGRGWVGDYEPLSTPILMLENCSPKEPVFVSKTNGNSNPRKNDKTSNPLPIQNHPISFSSSQGKPSLVSAAVTKPAASTAESVVVSSKEPLEGKLPFVSSGRTAPTTSSGNVSHQLRAAVTKPTESTAESAVVSAKEPLEVKQQFFTSGRTPPTTSANVNHQLHAAVIKPTDSTADRAMVSANQPLEGKHPFFSSGRAAPTTSANVSHQLRAAVTKPTNSTAEGTVVSANEPLEGKQPFFSSGRTAPTTSADVNHRPRAAVTKATDSTAEGAVVSANEPLDGKPPFFSSGRTAPTMSPDVNHQPRTAVTKAANSIAESAMVSANEPSEWKQPFFSSAKTTPTTSANVNQQLRAAVNRPTDSTAERAMIFGKEPLEGKQLFFSSGTTPTTSANVNHLLQSPRSKSNDSGKKVVKQLELNCSPFSANQNTCNFVSENQISNDLYVPASHSTENVSRNRNHMQSLPLKQPENHGFFSGGLPNGKLISNSFNRNGKVVSSDSIHKQMVTSATYIPHGPEHGLTDPVQLMRMLAENAEKQQEMVNYSPLYNLSVMPPVPSSRRDDSNNAFAAAAQAWMSVGNGMSTPASANTSGHSYPIFTDSLYNNTTRELQQRVSQHQGDFPIPGMHLQPAQNGFPFQVYGTPPVRMGNENRFQNRGMNFSPSVADLSRFQVQSPRQGMNSQRQPRQQQESLPPDLNNFLGQSSGSPVGQSSGVLLDTQYPDLALQL